jgi:hypothetical protein
MYVTAARFIALEDIVSGKASAFIDIHTHALARLIFGPKATLVENVPETLLFDVSRLSHLQGRVSYIAVGCTVIVMIHHKFESIKRENKGINSIGFLDSVLDDIKDLIKEGNINFSDFTTTLCEKLDSIHELTNSTERDKFINVVASAIGDPKDAVRTLM